MCRRLASINCLMLIAVARIAGSQQPLANPPADPRFKADILVVAPHPDDESTIAGYLARAVLDEHRRIAVVVTTRGDAGQNLVGYEQARSLAEIRETETRQALASIGITNVWFLRAPDTWAQDVSDVLRSLETSNHGSSLGEAVRFIRLTRPEVVITMLPATVVGENHEDHQAAAVIATEAFDLAGDPTWFPEQVASSEDHLWYGNLMEGLRAWQPKKLYYYTDASHFDFTKGRGPEYSMTDVSPSQHVSYARLAATEQSFHRTQYGDVPAKALVTNSLHDFEQPLPFVLGKSLVGGSIGGDIMDGIPSGPIPFAPARGYPGGNCLTAVGTLLRFHLSPERGYHLAQRLAQPGRPRRLHRLRADQISIGEGPGFRPLPILCQPQVERQAADPRGVGWRIHELSVAG